MTSPQLIVPCHFFLPEIFAMNSSISPYIRNCRLSILMAALISCLAATPGPGFAAPVGEPEVALELAPSEENPRNSEGSFVELADGSILFVYSHFRGGTSDHAEAYLAVRRSTDGGATWSESDEVVVENDAGKNVMSVSLNRLQDGRISMLYLRKNSLTDCRPVIRFSDDEAKTWSRPTAVIGEEQIGYYVVNNDRLVQLESGRLIVPASLHNTPKWDAFTSYGSIHCYLSDDGGRTWRVAAGSDDGLGLGGSVLGGSDPAGIGKPVMLQEPGVVEREGGSLMIWARTNAGSQYVSFSRDQGETWSDFRPSSLVSPISPASIKRIPSTGDLLAVWNDHSEVATALKGKRTPMTTAVSDDDGETWTHVRNLYDDPDGWYCYTAIAFRGDEVLLGHCAGDRTRENGLARSRITRVPVAWLYEDER